MPLFCEILQTHVFKLQVLEFPGGLVVKGSGVTAVAWKAAVARVQSPAGELLHAVRTATKI